MVCGKKKTPVFDEGRGSLGGLLTTLRVSLAKGKRGKDEVRGKFKPTALDGQLIRGKSP